MQKKTIFTGVCSPEDENHDKPGSVQLNLWNLKEDFPWDDYKVAREFVRSLGLKDKAEWEVYVQSGNLRGDGIPAEPEKVYRNRGWKDWEDWLGISEPEPPGEPPPASLFGHPKEGLWSHREGSTWMNFHEARRLAREYGFEYEEEWQLFVKGKFPARKPLPDEVPGNPDQVYRFVGWKGWKDWLADPENQVEYTGFYRAREFVRSCRLPDKEAWRSFMEGNASPAGEYHLVLPLRPHLEYRDSGWKDWEDWLGKQPDVKAGTPEPHTSEVIIDCKCGGRLKDCQQCDGKGYYTVQL